MSLRLENSPSLIWIQKVDDHKATVTHRAKIKCGLSILWLLREVLVGRFPFVALIQKVDDHKAAVTHWAEDQRWSQHSLIISEQRFAEYEKCGLCPCHIQNLMANVVIYFASIYHMYMEGKSLWLVSLKWM